MFDIFNSKFVPFNPDTFEFFDNTTYVVLVRYHENNQLGFATISVDEQEGFRDAKKYNHLYKKKFSLDQFSVLKIADLNYGFNVPDNFTTLEQSNNTWKLIEKPVTTITSSIWAIVIIKRPHFFNEDESMDYWCCQLAKISADPDDPLYGLYMTIYINKTLTNLAMDILVEDIGTPYAYQVIDMEQLASVATTAVSKVPDAQVNTADDHYLNRDDVKSRKNLSLTMISLIIVGFLMGIAAVYKFFLWGSI